MGYRELDGVDESAKSDGLGVGVLGRETDGALWLWLHQYITQNNSLARRRFGGT